MSCRRWCAPSGVHGSHVVTCQPEHIQCIKGHQVDDYMFTLKLLVEYAYQQSSEVTFQRHEFEVIHNIIGISEYHNGCGSRY